MALSLTDLPLNAEDAVDAEVRRGKRAIHFDSAREVLLRVPLRPLRPLRWEFENGPNSKICIDV